MKNQIKQFLSYALSGYWLQFTDEILVSLKARVKENNQEAVLKILNKLPAARRQKILNFSTENQNVLLAAPSEDMVWCLVKAGAAAHQPIIQVRRDYLPLSNGRMFWKTNHYNSTVVDILREKKELYHVALMLG